MLRVGEVFEGFCNGYFGRDSYSDKTVEAFGDDWVVCRTERGEVLLATFDGHKSMQNTVENWGNQKWM